MLRILLSLTLLLAFFTSTHAYEVTLAWDPNTEQDLAGYRLYWGYFSEHYLWNQEVGLEVCDKTTCIYSVELPDNLWFFSLKAYDILGNESGFSIQVWAKPPDICLGDFDQDGNVDISDLSLLVADFGRTDLHDTLDCRTDVDKDGDVDMQDVKLIADEYGRSDCQ